MIVSRQIAIMLIYKCKYPHISQMMLLPVHYNINQMTDLTDLIVHFKFSITKRSIDCTLRRDNGQPMQTEASVVSHSWPSTQQMFPKRLVFLFVNDLGQTSDSDLFGSNSDKYRYQ